MLAPSHACNVSRRLQRLVDGATVVAGKLRSAGRAFVRPLLTDTDVDMTLSIPEAQTTTIDGDIGWASRPPATVHCAECGGHIYQHRPDGTLDCPDCYAEYDIEEFPSLELSHFTCPVCGDEMVHGRRHPEQFDVPEWATCNRCRYHWEFEHF